MFKCYNYHKPETLDIALKLLDNNNSYPLAGGTDLLVQIRNEKIHPNIIVDIKGLDEIKGIKEEKKYIRIGAITTINEILSNPLIKPYSALIDGGIVLGCNEIRNRATIGGNICNASPSGDVLIPLLLFDAILIVKGNNKYVNSVPLIDFFAGPGKTILKKGELLTDILLPKLPKGFKSMYKRKTRVKGMDLSSIGMALSIKPSPYGYYFGIVFGAVTPTPIRMKSAEEILNNKPLNNKIIDSAIDDILNIISPRKSSLRGTPEYKREMVRVMLKDGINTLLEEEL